MRDQPLVSVITIFFNAEKFIEEAIESVLKQTYRRWEFLLVDDGSSDTSTAIARKYANLYPDKMKYVEHQNHKNQGMSEARNLGICHCHGEYVAFLDADDVWLPHKLERQVGILDLQPDAAMVYGASQYWYSWTGIPSDATLDYICDIGVCPDTLFQPCTLLNLLLKGLHSPCPSDLMVRREALHRVGGFEESFKGRNQLYEDQAFLAKVYLQEPVFVSNECWDRYRIHDGSCDAIVTKAGQHHAARLFFLNWLKEYLSVQRVENAEILVNLQHAFAPHVNGAEIDIPMENLVDLVDRKDIRRRQWWLKVEQGNVATLELLDRDGDTVKVAIEEAGTRPSHDVQLNEPRLPIDVNKTYLVSFMARADRPRCIFGGVAESYPPWNNLGLYGKFTLTPEWQCYEERFVATSCSNNARIHFDIGNSAVSLEVRAVRLRSLWDNKFIEPDIPPIHEVV